MRIGLVSREFPPETAHGGIGTQTYIKAHWFTGNGHDVCVFAGSGSSEFRVTDEEGIRVIRIPGFEGRMPMYQEAPEWLTYSGEVAVAISQEHERAPEVGSPVRNGAASRRKPDTPISSQNPMTLQISSRTAGLATFRSGWWW